MQSSVRAKDATTTLLGADDESLQKQAGVSGAVRMLRLRLPQRCSLSSLSVSARSMPAEMRVPPQKQARGLRSVYLFTGHI